jgi:glycosyltransferase involved in cell wall biosynthesis
MKVAFANAKFRTSANEGADAHVRQVAANSVAIGHEMYMWPPHVHPATKALPNGRLARLKVLRSCDVIYTRVQHDVQKPLTWTLGYHRALLGNPLFVWEFNTVPEYGEYRGMWPQQIRQEVEKFRYYGRGCDLAVCVSQHLADYVRNNLGIERTITIPNGSDPDLYTPAAEPVARVRKAPDVFNVLWIGSAFTAWHNFGLLAEAAKIVHQRGNPTNIVFHIIGPGMDQMRDMPPNVHYQGSEKYEFLPRWLAGMDVGLCLYKPGPADYSSPLKVFDYMASGLCVVSTDQPQTREIFGQLNQPDLLMPFDNAQLLADTLTSLSRDRDRVRRQGEAARKLLIEKYTWRRAIVDTFREIEKLLAQKRSRGRGVSPASSTTNTGETPVPQLSASSK